MTKVLGCEGCSAGDLAPEASYGDSRGEFETAYDLLRTAAPLHQVLFFAGAIRIGWSICSQLGGSHLDLEPPDERSPLPVGKVERGGVGYVRQNFWPLRQLSTSPM